MGTVIFDLCIPKAREKSTWSGADIAIRAQWMGGLFIGHPQARSLLEHVGERLVHLNRTLRPTATAFIGGTGVGKTTLVNQIFEAASKLYTMTADDRTLKPCIRLPIPAVCSPFELSVALLQALGESNPRSRRDKAATITASLKFLKACGVRLVVIDNLQDVPERRGKRGIEAIAAHLRNLIDASSALWIFLGTAAAIDVLHSNDQLLRRVSHRTYLNYFRIDTPADQRTFIGLLQQLDRWLPLTEPSCLSTPKSASAMHLATQGIFDRIVQLVDRGWQIALGEGTEVMEFRHLEAAYRFVNGSLADSGNPFSPDFVFRHLDKKGEPFEILRGGVSHARSKN